MSEDLYARDFYLWTQQQGAALRARRFGDNVLEIDRVAEEIEDLGSAQRNKAASFAQRIIEHLYKLSGAAAADPVRHWLVEIVNFREGLERALTPAIRGELEDELALLHKRGFRAAAKALKVYEPGVQLDPELRWSFAEIAGEAESDPFDAVLATLSGDDPIRPPRPQ